ncbi:DJ-1/PfpI family protein [Aurantivibrio plasticivorans]
MTQKIIQSQVYNTKNQTKQTGLDVVIALYPGVTQLDFTGPHQVFMRAPESTVRVAAMESALELDGLHFANLVSLRDIPSCDLLCIPGGFGAADAIHNPAFMAEIKRLASTANTLCSVCTGSLIFAAAGLLRGRKATCHWSWLEYLAQFPEVDVVGDRVVQDTNNQQTLLTGGGVTAGIDMALTAVGELFGQATAERIQLILEYNPRPPFNAGHPSTASADTVSALKTVLAPYMEGPREKILAFLENEVSA